MKDYALNRDFFYFIIFIMYNEIINILAFVKLNQQHALKVNKSKRLIIQINKIKAKIPIHQPIHLRHYLYITYFVLGLVF
jgi:hypothetical protein